MQATDSAAVVGVDEVGGAVPVVGVVVAEVLVVAVAFFGLPLELQPETTNPMSRATPMMDDRAGQSLDFGFCLKGILM
jgi:hypothetical protein